jgi:WD40 repeat protein
VQALALCPHSHDLYTASRDLRIKRWHPTSPAGLPPSERNPLDSPTCAATLSGHTDWVTALAATPFLLVSGSYDSTVRLWSNKSDKLLHTFREPHTDYVLCLSPAINADRFVSAGLRGHLHFWDLETCVRISVAQSTEADENSSIPNPVVWGGLVTSGSIYALDCSADGRLAALNGGHGCVPTSCPPRPVHAGATADALASKSGWLSGCASST